MATGPAGELPVDASCLVPLGAEHMESAGGSHILPGCGHWMQQERAEDVNRLLVDWLKTL